MNPDGVVPCDVLAIGPHPDDVEIALAGTLLRLRDAGKRIGIVDCTRGEKGSRGTAAERAGEAAAAAQLLGCAFRGNLGLPDGGVREGDDAGCDALVAALRAARPALLFAPLADDVHPDHVAADGLDGPASFNPGIKNPQPQPGATLRPRLQQRSPGNRAAGPPRG
ncbi:MAG: PIG-L family deacetylase, partial [Planctomycetota bacterium]